MAATARWKGKNSPCIKKILYAAAIILYKNFKAIQY